MAMSSSGGLSSIRLEKTCHGAGCVFGVDLAPPHTDTDALGRRTCFSLVPLHTETDSSIISSCSSKGPRTNQALIEGFRSAATSSEIPRYFFCCLSCNSLGSDCLQLSLPGELCRTREPCRHSAMERRPVGIGPQCLVLPLPLLSQ